VRCWNCSRICRGSRPRWSALSAPTQPEASTRSSCVRSHLASAWPRTPSAAA
jgi:hypothetical protein